MMNFFREKKNYANMVHRLYMFFFLCFSMTSFSQQLTVSGMVTDATSGSPIPGVNIIVKNTSNGVTTDFDGNYKIQVNQNDVLVFSFIGYEPIEKTVTASTINVSLKEDTQKLEEIVVIGYGVSRERDLTGSIAKIDDTEFQKGFVTNAEQLIANKVPGVQVVPSSGRPGAGSSFVIRGGASLNASNDPLIVIDGVSTEGYGDGPGFLSSLNPDDIESFTVLKDASSAAIYGSRGSNGVIIITTKKGKDDELKFSFTSKLSVSSIIKKQSVLTGDQYREVAQTASAYYGLPIEDVNLGTANTDWQDEIYQAAIGVDNNFSVSGGLDKIPYRFSVGYLTQDGILKTSNYERITSTLNSNPTFFDNHLKVNISLKGSKENEQIADERAITSAILFNPTHPVRTESSNYGGYFEYEDFESNPANLHGHYNPVGMLEQVNNQQESFRSIGNIQLDYKFHFLPELHLNVNTGYDIAQTKTSYFIPATAFEQHLAFGSDYKADPSSKKNNVFLESYFNYVKEFKSIDSRLDAMVGYSYNDFKTTNYYYSTYDVFGDMHPGSEPSNDFDIPRNTLISFYGRLNYFFKDKYLLTGTVRKDGSSRFSKNNRWGVFPSLAFAWKISEEEFLKDSETITNLKLRAGYGVTGQQDGIGNYDYIPLYFLGELSHLYPIGDNFYQRILPSTTDRNRKWEQTATTNIGLDWGVLKDRLTGSIDVYTKETTDLLNTVNVPLGTDFGSSITKNIGSLENKGVEISINASPIKTEIFNWDFALNYTFNENKITSLSFTDDDGVGLFSGEYLVNTVGHSRNTFYLYHQVYDTEGNPVEETMLDVNKDGLVNDKDRYRSKSSVPKHVIGFSTNLNFNKLTVNMAFHANLGHYIYYNPSDNLSDVYGTVPFNISTAYYDTNFKMVGNQQQYYSDYYLQNASFLKMDNLNVNYDLGKIFKSFNTDARLNLTASVQNVFTITNYTGSDPEASWNWGLDWGGNYPIPRIYALALNLNF